MLVEDVVCSRESRPQVVFVFPQSFRFAEECMKEASSPSLAEPTMPGRMLRDWYATERTRRSWNMEGLIVYVMLGSPAIRVTPKTMYQKAV